MELVEDRLAELAPVKGGVGSSRRRPAAMEERGRPRRLAAATEEREQPRQLAAQLRRGRRRV